MGAGEDFCRETSINKGVKTYSFSKELWYSASAVPGATIPFRQNNPVTAQALQLV